MRARVAGVALVMSAVLAVLAVRPDGISRAGTSSVQLQNGNDAGASRPPAPQHSNPAPAPGNVAVEDAGEPPNAAVSSSPVVGDHPNDADHVGGDPATNFRAPWLVSRAMKCEERTSNEQNRPAGDSAGALTKDVFEVFSTLRCPRFETLSDNDDKDADRRSDWVTQKYTYYATRCNRTNGMMWKQLTRASHDRIAERVLSLLGVVDLPPTASEAKAQPNQRHQQTRNNGPAVLPTALRRKLKSRGHLSVLDWASGCGVSLAYFAATLPQRGFKTFAGVGVDITEGAVGYANRSFLSASSSERKLLFCHADGTKLQWLPSASFDLVTAFGGLLHLPSKVMCGTLSQLMRVLKRDGAIWAGYIDNKETASLLLRCRFDCSAIGSTVVATVINENVWFRGISIPAANKKAKPVSIVWERV